jgi:hypothetical protein
MLTVLAGTVIVIVWGGGRGEDVGNNNGEQVSGKGARWKKFLG